MDAQKYYTIDDIRALPEGSRSEVIDGMWYDMSSPNGYHQWIVGKVYSAIDSYISQNGGQCQVFVAPFAVYLGEDSFNYVEPDIVVLCDREKLKKDGIHGAPDLIIEVSSPSTEKRDNGVKLFKYRTAGVKEYWIINPDTKSINTYLFCNEDNEEEGRNYSFDMDATFSLYPDLSVNLAQIMAELGDLG